MNYQGKRALRFFLTLAMFVSLFSVFNPTANAVSITLEKNWSSVASSSDGTKIVALANGGKIYVSSDSGATWSAKESDRNWRSVASSADGTKLVAVDGGGKIYISSDSGATWSAKESDRNWNSVASSADGTKLFATVAGGQIYVSSDSGATWSAKAINKSWTSISSTADGTKLIATAYYQSQVYESNDSGLTWAPNGSTFLMDWLTSASSATAGQKFASASGHIYFSYYSDYYGSDVYEAFANQPGVVDPTWGPGGTWVSLASSADGTKLVALDSGGQIWITNDSGANWSAKESNRDWTSVASSADGTKLVATVSNGPIFLSSNSGETWTTVSTNQNLVDGIYDCNTGLITENTTNVFTIIEDVVTVNGDLGTYCADSVIIPSGVTSISDGVFANNLDMTSVTIPNSVTSIGNAAFANTRLVSVTIPDSVTTLGESVFQDIPTLTSATIGNGLTSIPTWTFFNSSLTSVTIGNSVTYIGGDAFNGTRLVSVTIPDSVTAIADGAFNNIPTLTSVTIGSFVGEIGTSFYNNPLLTAVTFLGNAPGLVGETPFAGSALNAKAIVGLNATGFDPIEGLWNGLVVSFFCYTVTEGVLEDGRSCSGDVVIDNSVTSIGNGAFSGNANINSVTIPDSVITIGNDAFLYTSLTSVTIGNSVTSIGNGAFDTNYALTSLTLGNSVEFIGQFAFYNTLLTSVTIPASVTSIDQYAFTNSNSLATFTFLGNAPTVTDTTFLDVAAGAIANVAINATGFDLVDGLWNGLVVVYGNPPVSDSGSSTPAVVTPVAGKSPDAFMNNKNAKSLSKREIKTMLDKNKTFKNYPVDKYKYSIFGTSKKTCAIKGNFVVALKDTGACEMWVTRTTAKGKNYKYWVKINYLQ